MELLTRIKKLASILLLICLFLPLSQCTESTRDGKESITVHYGHQILIDSTIETFEDGFDWEKLLATFIFFSFIFSPLITLALKTPIQQIAAIIFTLPASLVIYGHFIVYTPRIGILLATVLWTIIVIASLTELYCHIKQLKKNRIQEKNIPSNH